MTLIISLLMLATMAAGPFYAGSWKISSAVVAPWWSEARKPDPAETITLIGQVVVIGATGIKGPRQTACRDPHYQVKVYTADMLFQGMFGELQSRDKSKDPAKASARLGFNGSRWKTLETGCGNELDYHFIDDRTATFGLNNYIYTLIKQ